MKKILLGMLLLVSLMLCVSSPVWALLADLDAANAAYKQGHYDEAIRLYTKVIEYRITAEGAVADMLRADKAAAYANRGMCWKRKGDYDRAIFDLTAALSLAVGPGRCSVRHKRGGVYYLKGDWDKALEDFTADETCFWNSQDKLIVGHISITKGHYYGAVRLISDSIRSDPGNANAFCIRGLAWANKGIYYKAIADFDMAIAINPNLTQAITMRNKVLEKQRKTGTGQ